MAGILRGLISPALTQVAKARGAYLAGEREAQKEGVANAIAQLKAKREAESASILDALHRAQTTKALQPPTPKPLDFIFDQANNAYAKTPEGLKKLASDQATGDFRVPTATPTAPIAPQPPATDDVVGPTGATGEAPPTKQPPEGTGKFGSRPPSDHVIVAELGGDPNVPGSGKKVAINSRTGETVRELGASKTPTPSLRNLLSTITAGSAIGSVDEMESVLPNLEEYERGAIQQAASNPQSVQAWDVFRQKLITNAQQNHGFVSAATAALALDDLAKTNPDLAMYGRNIAAWIVSDLNVSKGATDERGRMDVLASSVLGFPLTAMAGPKGTQLVDQLIRSRRARLGGLKEGVAKARSMMSVPGAGAASGGPPSKAGSLSALRAAAEAQLRAQGMTDAQILQELGPPDGDE